MAQPAMINAPSFDLVDIFAGQERVTIGDILRGAVVTVEEGGSGILGKFSTPVSWKPDYDVATPLGRQFMSPSRFPARGCVYLTSLGRRSATDGNAM